MNIKKIVGLVVMASFVGAPASFAHSKLMKSCKKDLKKFGCMAKTDAEAHECLEKNEKHDAKNDGFSHGCYEAHESYEKSMNKEEKGEEHHEEGAEHHE